MTRLPLAVVACVLVASAVGVGAFGPGPGAAALAESEDRALAGPDGGLAESEVRAPGVTGTDEAGDAGNDEASDDEDRVLVVADAETDERLLTVPVSEGTTVALNYTHSVERTPVRDVYAVNGTELEMVRMEFQSYGAGLPARADVNVTENGTFVFDPEGSYDHIYVTPGEIAGHELVVGDRTYDLVALSDARSVRVSVTRVGDDDRPRESATTTQTLT